MTLSSLQDVFSLIGAICLVWITIFLCWTLYQIGKLVRQANTVVKDTREKVERFEHSVISLGERLASTSQYLGLIAEGGKQLVSFLHKREKKTDEGKKKKNGKLSEMEDD
ncbi:MAG TPA: hypothetical protein VFQ60_04065 [Patescibacteria group bacterium]|nr:hypothetical protein [Patescibacteria group bacterium]